MERVKIDAIMVGVIPARYGNFADGDVCGLGNGRLQRKIRHPQQTLPRKRGREWVGAGARCCR
jgi:hypothetical protein